MSAVIETQGLDPVQKAGTLSGGQRAQLLLTLAIAKRPSRRRQVRELTVGVIGGRI